MYFGLEVHVVEMQKYMLKNLNFFNRTFIEEESCESYTIIFSSFAGVGILYHLFTVNQKA